MSFNTMRGRSDDFWFNSNDNSRYSNKRGITSDTTTSLTNDGVDIEFPKLPTTPGIYSLIKLSKNKLDIVYESNIIQTKEIILGTTTKRVMREWTRFCKYDETVGSINDGDSGGGKTLKCDILANLAVLKGNMVVLKVAGFEPTEKEIQFFQTINHCCLYFDEFDKLFSMEIQNKMLSLLTNQSKKFLVLITGNETRRISNFLYGRTQRARYRESFNKIDEQFVKDYMSLYPNIREDFKEEFLSRYRKALTFSVDNLEGVISEHLDYPDDTLDELLEYLNIQTLSKTKVYRLYKVEENYVDEDGKEAVFEVPAEFLDRNCELTDNHMKHGWYFSYLSHKYQPKNPTSKVSNLKFNKDDILYNMDGVLILKDGNFNITFKQFD